MAWDDSKDPEDLIRSSEWNMMVQDQKGRVVGTSISEVIADTSGNLPAAGTSGRIFFETDTGRTLYDNGTSWIEVGLSESQINLSNINAEFLDFNNRTTDPPLAAGATWFRSDQELLKFSPDGSTTQQIGWTI